MKNLFCPSFTRFILPLLPSCMSRSPLSLSLSISHPYLITLISLFYHNDRLYSSQFFKECHYYSMISEKFFLSSFLCCFGFPARSRLQQRTILFIGIPIISLSYYLTDHLTHILMMRMMIRLINMMIIFRISDITLIYGSLKEHPMKYSFNLLYFIHSFIHSLPTYHEYRYCVM